MLFETISMHIQQKHFSSDDHSLLLTFYPNGGLTGKTSFLVDADHPSREFYGVYSNMIAHVSFSIFCEFNDSIAGPTLICISGKIVKKAKKEIDCLIATCVQIQDFQQSTSYKNYDLVLYSKKQTGYVYSRTPFELTNN